MRYGRTLLTALTTVVAANSAMATSVATITESEPSGYTYSYESQSHNDCAAHSNIIFTQKYAFYGNTNLDADWFGSTASALMGNGQTTVTVDCTELEGAINSPDLLDEAFAAAVNEQVQLIIGELSIPGAGWIAAAIHTAVGQTSDKDHPANIAIEHLGCLNGHQSADEITDCVWSNYQYTIDRQHAVELYYG